MKIPTLRFLRCAASVSRVRWSTRDRLEQFRTFSQKMSRAASSATKTWIWAETLQTLDCFYEHSS